MNEDTIGTTVTVRTRLAKFHGEDTTGEPYEVVEHEETLPFAQFMARYGDDGQPVVMGVEVGG